MRQSRTILIVVLSMLLLITSALFVWDIYNFQQNQMLVPRHRARDLVAFIRAQGRAIASSNPATAKNVQPWMTFDFLNKTYRLPTSYLRSTLNITDARYPNLSISRYAFSKRESTSSTIAAVEAAIRTYAATSTQPY